MLALRHTVCPYLRFARVLVDIARSLADLACLCVSVSALSDAVSAAAASSPHPAGTLAPPAALSATAAAGQSTRHFSFKKHDERLEWRNVTLRLRGGGRVLLDRVSGAAEPGRVLGLMGPSGAGKTTMLSALR